MNRRASLVRASISSVSIDSNSSSLVQLVTIIETSGLYYKSFMIVTYDRNDSSVHYKTTLLA